MPTRRVTPKWIAPAVPIALAVALSVLLLLPGGALANNDNYACELTPSAGVVKKIVGLPHAVKRKSGGGGTAEDLGSYSSQCAVFAFKKKAKKGVSPVGRPSNRFRVRKGYTLLHVSTTVQDDGEAGENWDCYKVAEVIHEEAAALAREWGGFQLHAGYFPDFGRSFAGGAFFGYPEDNVFAQWDYCPEGVIRLRFASFGEANRLFRKLIKLIVPKFSP